MISTHQGRCAWSETSTSSSVWVLMKNLTTRKTSHLVNIWISVKSMQTARQINEADSLSHRMSLWAIYHFITWATHFPRWFSIETCPTEQILIVCLANHCERLLISSVSKTHTNKCTHIHLDWISAFWSELVITHREERQITDWVKEWGGNLTEEKQSSNHQYNNY